MTFSYAQINRLARIWLKIICHCLIPGKHMIEVTQYWGFLIYALMQEGFMINMSVVII